MRRAFASAAFLYCALLVFPQTPKASEDLAVRAAAARPAVERAARALEEGNTEGALRASDEASALDPANADARYLYAISALRAGLPLPEAETALRIALAGGKFLRYSPDEAARLLAHILVRTKRYPEALELVERPGLAADSDALYIRAQALRSMGNTEAFLRTVDAGLERFPSDARIVRELLEFAALAPRTEEIASRVLRVEKRMGYYRYLDPELILLVSPFYADVSQRRDAVLEYRAMRHRNPKAAVSALELGILDDKAASLEFFSFDSLSWSDLRRLKGLLRDDEGRRAFAEAFSAYSGEIGYDANGDGEYETRTKYNKGSVESWRLDFDQNGIPEAQLEFSENLPVSGVLTLAGGEMLLEYGDYPYLAQVRFVTEEGVHEYLFSPDSLPFPIVELSPEAHGASGNEYAPVRTKADPPSESACAAAAYRVTERTRPPVPPIRVTDMDQGIPVRSLVKTMDGRSGILVYRGGAPVYELADMDGDGLFESRYLYAPIVLDSAGGKASSSPIEFEADFDLNGEYEYHEGLVFPFERTWDYTGDGKVDARVTAMNDGGELWEFSRSFDGRLDTAIVLQQGRIVRVLRGGADVPLTADSGGRVLWVGVKPFDFGNVVPSPGSGTQGGVRYRVIRFGNQLVAEVAE